MLEHILSTRAYWEGKWIDLWTIPHTLFGTMMALGGSLWGAAVAASYGWTATIALGWELFERITGIGKTETPTNSLTDIAVALIGFAIGWLFVRYVPNRRVRITVMAVCAAIWIVVEVLGWIAYRRYAGAVS